MNFDLFTTSVGGLHIIGVLTNGILHIAFAIGVYQAAAKGVADGRKTWLVGPLSWCFGTLVLGPFFAAVYWVAHHSSIGGFNDDALKAIRERRAAIKHHRE